MKRFLFCVVALGVIASLGMFAACGGDGDSDKVCEYDKASATCQQAYDCCVQYTEWATSTGVAPTDCYPYTCVDTPDSTCQAWITQALAAEQTYEVDFPDCN